MKRLGAEISIEEESLGNALLSELNKYKRVNYHLLALREKHKKEICSVLKELEKAEAQAMNQTLAWARQVRRVMLFEVSKMQRKISDFMTPEKRTFYQSKRRTHSANLSRKSISRDEIEQQRQKKKAALDSMFKRRAERKQESTEPRFN